MDLRIQTRAVQRLVLSALVLVAGAAAAERTLWLVRPLYPGQETLVERTEKALDKLMPGAARQETVIGVKELAATLKGKVATELPCFAVDARCADPIDPFLATFGFERIVLVQGGQDEAGFKYRVVSYEPASGKVNPASATNANLEKALLGAVAKVVPAASTLEVKSTPPGAVIYVDDVKVGTTPLNTQVLPGERVVRFDLKLHQPVEESIVVPIRGTASLEKTLEKVAARIVISASPAGTEISIDGQVVGKDKVDRGIAPGDHVIRLTAEKHKAFEQTVSVKADQQFALDKTLEPLPGVVLPPTAVDPNRPDKVAVVIRGDPPPPVVPPPPPPKTPTELIYERRSYFHATFEFGSLTRDTLVGRRFGNDGTGRTTKVRAANLSLIGASAEYGTFGKYFGVTVFGVSYLTNLDSWSMGVGFEQGRAREVEAGVTGPASIDNVRVHLVSLRALHPQFRVAFWRFQLSLQVGLEFRSGNIVGTDPGATTTFYKDGFVPLELLLGARFNLRFYVVDGLFLQLQGNYTQYLIGERATDDEGGGDFGSASSWGINGGLGYAF